MIACKESEAGTPPKMTERLLRATNCASKGVEFLKLLHAPDSVYEIRILNCPENVGRSFVTTAAGYFKGVERVGKQIQEWEMRAMPPAIYVTLNPCEPALRSRAFEKIKWKAKETTQDQDIVRRQNLLVDIDPIRPAGISTTGEEMNAALTCADEVKQFLRSSGWPDPLEGMSGNGAYLIYRIDLPNDNQSRELIRQCLHSLGQRFNTPSVEIDTSTFNAARIVKVLGTMARKGDDCPDRPHRQSWFRPPDSPMVAVTAEQLSALASEYSEQPKLAAAPANLQMPTTAAVARARAYLEKIPNSVSGEKGSDKAMRAACELYRFGLDDATARALFAEFNNSKCHPPWSEKELDHKLQDARKEVERKGEFGARLQTQGKPSQCGGDLSNYQVEISEGKDGTLVKSKTAIPQRQLVESILSRFDGWPKQYGGQLFVCPAGKVEVLSKPNHLFSWMRENANVTWGNGESMVNRDELYSSLLRHAEAFDDIQHHPHFPKVDRVYYSCPEYQPGDGRHLERFLDYFSPATAVDRQLILGATITTCWGGPPGQRPTQLIEAAPYAGQGSGKSTLAQLISQITGG